MKFSLNSRSLRSISSRFSYVAAAAAAAAAVVAVALVAGGGAVASPGPLDIKSQMCNKTWGKLRGTSEENIPSKGSPLAAGCKMAGR